MLVLERAVEDFCPVMYSSNLITYFPIKTVCGSIQTPRIKLFVERFILVVNFTAQESIEMG